MVGSKIKAFGQGQKAKGKSASNPLPLALRRFSR
jgi:hypothetical protein